MSRAVFVCYTIRLSGTRSLVFFLYFHEREIFFLWFCPWEKLVDGNMLVHAVVFCLCCLFSRWFLSRTVLSEYICFWSSSIMGKRTSKEKNEKTRNSLHPVYEWNTEFTWFQFIRASNKIDRIAVLVHHFFWWRHTIKLHHRRENPDGMKINLQWWIILAGREEFIEPS